MIKTAVAIAVYIYNDGASRINDMEVSAGIFTMEFLTDKATSRIMFVQRQARLVISVYRPANRYGYLKAIHTSKLTHYYKIKLGLLKGYVFLYN